MPSTLDILLNEPLSPINPHLHGHFMEHLGACIYDGAFSNGQPCQPVIDLLRRIAPPIIRWPGGCFADDYHWQDGIGPIAGRPRRVNIHWGEVIEPNQFGTHEFIHLCRMLGAEPYLSGNVGSGSPRELRDWVEYCNFPSGSTLSDLRAANGSPSPFNVRFWGIGNEMWGCGGHFSPEAYACEFRRYATFMRDFADKPLTLIACGPDGNDLDWTRRFFEHLHRDWKPFPRIHGYAPHYYCGTAGTATVYSESQWYELLWKAARMEDLIVQQREVMDEYDPHRRIGMMIDEWGTWHAPTPGRNPKFLWQQNTLRDALVAALTLDIFHRHADKVVMANIAQAINVLQALVLTDNGRAIATPTWHVYDLYRPHRGATSVRLECNSPSITFEHDGQMRRLPGLSGSASVKDRSLTLTIVNPRLGEALEAEIRLQGGATALEVRETILTDPDIQAHNTFDDPHRLHPTEPRILSLQGQRLPYAFPPQSITRLDISL